MKNNVKKTDHPSEKNKGVLSIAEIIAVSLFFAFNLFIFAPVQIYYLNIVDFWFSLGSFIIMPVVCFAAGFVLSFLPCFFLRRKKVGGILLALIFAGSVGLYIQGNFLNAAYPILTGDEIDWNGMAAMGVFNTVFWVLLFAAALFFFIKKSGIFKNIAKFGAFIITAIQIVTIVTLALTTKAPAASAYLSDKNIYTLSSKQNIVTIVSDTFEGAYLRRAFNEFPKIKDDFKDFTFYENTSGVSTLTYLSMSELLTGEIFPMGKSLTDGINDCYQNSDFFDDMHKNGYDVNYFTHQNMIGANAFGQVDNLMKMSDKDINNRFRIAAAKYFYKITAFEYAPHFLKKYVKINYNGLAKAKSLLDIQSYKEDDFSFRKDLLQKGVEVKDNIHKQYMVYHLEGVHAPILYDRDFKKIEFADTVSYEDRRYEGSLAQIKLFKEFIQSLKKAGVYDNTTIIITADHGHANRFNPVLLIKPAHASHAFGVSQTPISILGDYNSFIRELAQSKTPVLYALPDNSERERYVYNYYLNNSYGEPTKSRSKIAVDGPANDLKNYKTIDDSFTEKEEGIGIYTPGAKLEIANGSAGAYMRGFTSDGWSYTKTALISLDFGRKIDKNVQVVIDTKQAYNGSQRINISAGDQEVYSGAVGPGAQAISFSVDPSLFSGNTLNLKFNFPDASQVAVTGRILAELYFYAVQFDTIEAR